MHLDYQDNTLTMIVGPMFSSKTSTLLSYIERYSYAKKHIGVFSIAKDTRYSISSITTHTGRTVSSIAVTSAAGILEEVEQDNYDIIFIDEVQFFSNEIVDVVDTLLNSGKRIIAAGLDTDFAGRGFGPVPELLARADIVVKLTAVCTICGKAATRSQRLVNGKPARLNEEIFLLGAEESYEARCASHHEVLAGRDEK